MEFFKSETGRVTEKGRTGDAVMTQSRKSPLGTGIWVLLAWAHRTCDRQRIVKGG